MTAVSASRGVYLDAYLRPLAVWLERPDVTDILINAPGELWVETIGGETRRFEAPELTETALWRLATQIASMAHQGVNRENPLLAATLPDGARVQIVAPPATRGPMAIAIRKHVVADLSLDDYDAAGAFDTARSVGLHDRSAEDADLEAALSAGDMASFLRLAVQRRKNIIVSGGTLNSTDAAGLKLSFGHAPSVIAMPIGAVLRTARRRWRSCSICSNRVVLSRLIAVWAASDSSSVICSSFQLRLSRQ